MWERRKKKQGGGDLTPDSECNVSLEVSIGESGDVAGVATLVRLLCAGDEQS